MWADPQSGELIQRHNSYYTKKKLFLINMIDDKVTQIMGSKDPSNRKKTNVF